MTEDLRRLTHIPGCLYNFHPGSHVGRGAAKGIEHITDMLNNVLRARPTAAVLLETMSGKGSEVGRSFCELAAVLEGVAAPDRVGVCLDTCHVFDAGYDIVNDPDGVLADFDRVIGLSRLKAVHLNDSLNPLGSRKDRHAKIGEGRIGLAALTRLINHPVLRDLPFYLETPNDTAGYAREIALLKSLYV
jgi:deoxyribonuclease-4